MTTIKQKHPNSTCSIGPLGTHNQKVVAKHYSPARVDFSDLPQRITNSSSRAPYIPQDRTVYRAGSVDGGRPRVRGV